MSRPEEPDSVSNFEEFLEKPTAALSHWSRVWDTDEAFPTRTHRTGLAAKLVLGTKRLLRVFQPIVRLPQADLWERQRVFNQIVVDHLTELRSAADDLAGDLETIGRDLQAVQQEVLRDLRRVQRDIHADVQGVSEDLDDFRRKGMVDVMRHTDALFSRLDQKVDRLRRSAALLDTRASRDTIRDD